MPEPPPSADASPGAGGPPDSDGYSFGRHLQLELGEYDAAIRRFIPGYEAMLQQAAEHALSVGPSHVLDLGAGTGALSEAVLQHSADVHVEVLDLDPGMLDLARQRLQGYGERVRFRQASFSGPLPRAGAVTASLALHHLPDVPAKREVFRRIHDALPEGGIFVNADITLPAEHGLREAAYQGWADHLVAAGTDRIQAFRHFRQWSDEDTYLPAEAELAALEEVGFQARVAWRCRVSTLVVAIRDIS